MIFVSFNSNTTGHTTEAGPAFPSEAPSSPRVFHLILAAIILYVLRLTASDYPFRIFKPFNRKIRGKNIETQNI